MARDRKYAATAGPAGDVINDPPTARAIVKGNRAGHAAICVLAQGNDPTIGDRFAVARHRAVPGAAEINGRGGEGGGKLQLLDLGADIQGIFAGGAIFDGSNQAVAQVVGKDGDGNRVVLLGDQLGNDALHKTLNPARIRRASLARAGFRRIGRRRAGFNGGSQRLEGRRGLEVGWLMGSG